MFVPYFALIWSLFCSLFVPYLVLVLVHVCSLFGPYLVLILFPICSLFGPCFGAEIPYLGSYFVLIWSLLLSILVFVVCVVCGMTL